MVTQKCAICEVRPVRNGVYCSNCSAKLKKERRKNGKHDSLIIKYLVYRGNVAGLVSDGNSKLKPVLVTTNPTKLPKGKVIDLDHYCEGFDRKTIKRFKAAVLQVCAA